VRGSVLGLYLSDPVAKSLILRTRHDELTIDLQRQLLVALLQIELRHRLIDERLRARAAGGSFFRAGLRLRRACRWL
jgi:hypothetical protein